jgi:hypothetical protein
MWSHAIYVRIPEREHRDLVAGGEAAVAALDVAARLADGRAIDLGRRGWDELGCLLEGGISTPKAGPTVGEHPLCALDDREAWSFVSPARAAAFARDLEEISHEAFLGLYQVGDDGTAEGMVDELTGASSDRAGQLFDKLTQLRAHYQKAAALGEAMLVRIAKR